MTLNLVWHICTPRTFQTKNTHSVNSTVKHDVNSIFLVLLLQVNAFLLDTFKSFFFVWWLPFVLHTLTMNELWTVCSHCVAPERPEQRRRPACKPQTGWLDRAPAGKRRLTELTPAQHAAFLTRVPPPAAVILCLLPFPCHKIQQQTLCLHAA